MEIVQLIQITAAYSNAVLLAIMPEIAGYAKNLNLNLSHPVTISQVAKFKASPFKNQPGGAVFLTNGMIFRHSFGYVSSFEDPHNYCSLQNPDDVRLFYGKLNMSSNEAVYMARSAITNLGYADKLPILNNHPEINGPTKYGTNLVPFYCLEWKLGEFTAPWVSIAIDAENKVVRKLSIVSKDLNKPYPQIDVVPPLNPIYLKQRSATNAITRRDAPRLLPQSKPK